MGLAAALLTACGDKPRGPLEVQGKTMLMEPRMGFSPVPVTVEFQNREKGQIVNNKTGETQAFTYTLEGTELVLHTIHKSGKPENPTNFSLDGQRYAGDDVILKEMSEKDVQDIAQKVQQLKEQEAQEQARQAQEQQKAQELAAKLSPQGAPKDPATYTNVSTIEDTAHNWATWLYIAHKHHDTPREEEELLRLFSAPWNTTKDSFERQAMRAAELERIAQRLGEVRAMEYIQIPWQEARNTLGLEIRASTDGSTYDFENKSFRLSGTLCDYESTLHTDSGARFTVSQDKAFCALPVPDEAMARQIETARTSRAGVHLRPHGYFKVVGMSEGNITLVPVGLDIALHEGNKYQQRAGELVTQISHWPH